MTLDEIKALSPKDDDFMIDMMDFMVDAIPYEFHLRKAMEECFELGEVLAKILNKSKDNQPSRSRVAEELADVNLRVACVMGTLYKDDPSIDGMEVGMGAMADAMEAKLTKIQGWLKEGKLYNMKM